MIRPPSSGETAQPVRSGSRTTKQERSAQRQQQITETAVSVIAEHGVDGVTHRLVARRSKVSVAATTYYFNTKCDIVTAASDHLLARYEGAFRRLADRLRDNPGTSLAAILRRLVEHGAGKYRLGTLAWCEIILDAHGRPEGALQARRWYDRVTGIWIEIAKLLGEPEPERAARSAIDTAVGLLFVALPLGADEVFQLPQDGWPDQEDNEAGVRTDRNASSGTRKPSARDRIVDAAVEVLLLGGSGAVTYQAVASRAGVSPAAPNYHFRTVDALLHAAQFHVFTQSKQRYRDVMRNEPSGIVDAQRLADLTATVFVREATEFRDLSRAMYPIRLESARKPGLVPVVRAMVNDQNNAWMRLLRRGSPSLGPSEAVTAQALFAGKLVRMLAVGADTLMLAESRGEFAWDFERLLAGTHWSQGRK